MSKKHILKTATKKRNWDKDFLTRAVGRIKLMVTDASINHDSYLYAGFELIEP